MQSARGVVQCVLLICLCVPVSEAAKRGGGGVPAVPNSTVLQKHFVDPVFLANKTSGDNSGMHRSYHPSPGVKRDDIDALKGAKAIAEAHASLRRFVQSSAQQPGPMFVQKRAVVSNGPGATGGGVAGMFEIHGQPMFHPQDAASVAGGPVHAG